MSGQRLKVLERIEGGRQQGVIADVGRRRDRGQRNAATLGQLRALQAALAAVNGAATGALTSADGLVVQPSTARSARSRPIIVS